MLRNAVERALDAVDALESLRQPWLNLGSKHDVDGRGSGRKGSSRGRQQLNRHSRRPGCGGGYTKAEFGCFLILRRTGVGRAGEGDEKILDIEGGLYIKRDYDGKVRRLKEQVKKKVVYDEAEQGEKFMKWIIGRVYRNVLIIKKRGGEEVSRKIKPLLGCRNQKEVEENGGRRKS